LRSVGDGSYRFFQSVGDGSYRFPTYRFPSTSELRLAYNAGNLAKYGKTQELDNLILGDGLKSHFRPSRSSQNIRNYTGRGHQPDTGQSVHALCFWPMDDKKRQKQSVWKICGWYSGALPYRTGSKTSASAYWWEITWLQTQVKEREPNMFAHEGIFSMSEW